MKSLLSILTLSLSTHALAFNIALAAAIERNGRATPTITKTIYHTEIRRLSTEYVSNLGRNARAIHDSSAPFSIKGVSKDESDRAASSMSTASLRPRKPSGKKPTISQLPVTGVPVIFTTWEAESVSSKDASKRDQILGLESEFVNKRNANLYNMKIDLTPEGYISVYMPNSTAFTFCESEVERNSNDAPKARELHLAVLDATKTITIPIHGDLVTSFCLDFKNAENRNGPKSGKLTESSTASAPLSKEKTAKVSTSEHPPGNTSRISKHTSSKTTASEINSDSSRSPVSTSSATKTRSLQTEEISSESEIIKSAKHASTSTISPDDNSITPASATDLSSKTKTKSSANEADEDASETAESPRASTAIQSADSDSSDPETSTSHSTKSKSKTSEAEETENPSTSTASLKKNHGSHTTSTDPDTSSTLKATPAALPGSAFPETTTDEPFTVSSMNSFYPYIASYLETAEDSTPTADSQDLSFITTTDSVNGAMKCGRAAIWTAAMKVARAAQAPQLTDSSMNYTSDYSWLGNVSTRQLSDSATSSAMATPLPSTNAAMKRLKPPFLFWRREKDSRPGEEPEQEKKEFFKITVEDEHPTRVSAGKTGIEDLVIATRLALKQQDNDEDADGAKGKDEEKNEDEIPADKDQTPDEETEPEKKETGDGDKEIESTKSKPSHTKTSANEVEDVKPTTDASADIDEEPTSPNNPADDEEATPTSDSTDDTPPDDDAPANADDNEPEDDTFTTSSHKPKSTNTPPSTKSDQNTDAEPTTESKSTKSKVSIPTLASGVSFEFPSTKPSRPDAKNMPSTTSQLPTPPPPPTGTAPIPTAPIIWDPDCPQLSTSTLTAPNGLTTTVPTTIGLGCWRTLPLSSSPSNTSSASSSIHAKSAFDILSDPQNIQFAFFCWCIIGFVFLQWFAEQLQFLRGEWHLGRRFVWWVLGVEGLGIGKWILERREEAEREWERKEKEREADRLAGGGR